MEAISMDLRRRVLHALDVEKQSRVEVARRFGVSNSWIWKLLQRRKAVGSIEPLPHGGGRPGSPRAAGGAQGGGG